MDQKPFEELDDEFNDIDNVSDFNLNTNHYVISNLCIEACKWNTV